MHYQRKGLNDAASMPNIESIQFFDSIAVVRKRKQLPRYHVMVPSFWMVAHSQHRSVNFLAQQSIFRSRCTVSGCAMILYGSARLAHPGPLRANSFGARATF